MRVVDPKEFDRVRRRGKSSKGKFALVGIAVLVPVLAIGAIVSMRMQPKQAPAVLSESVSAPPPRKEVPVLPVREMSGEEFKQLYQNFYYPNTELLTKIPQITGNPSADERIRTLAEKRGYRLGRVPKNAIVQVDEPMLGQQNLLQPLAAEGWTALKTAAQKDSIKLTLISAYRSVNDQKTLFMQRLLAQGVTLDQIAAGTGDAAVEATLSLTAVPGYSRHHSGFTVDLWCEDGTGGFGASSCYQWIKADNYKIAKEHGWIPSYPEGADLQGPEPEPWEFVWVGRQNVQ